ncbi:cold-shock protein [Cellulomonas endophytica]|uniref:cold-shock protein n=1 Tax=Cellulomonas endophytica TaxID=2494735 RepID=UPI0010123336|nr:cold shock domain-containing protein [Cellulomonas endophytica]
MPQGTVRWFDAERGFGFIALDDGGEDLFVHASEVVDDDGARLLREGQVVEFEVGAGDRGPQARRVHVTGDVPPDAPLGLLGAVTWYEPSKGYGFLTPEDGGPEIFVHSSAIVGGGVVVEGQRVAFLVVDGEKGPQADHLLPLGPEPARSAAVADGADGTVTWYDAEKGFGFIAPDSGGGDVFAHARSLAGGLAELAEGDRVTFGVVDGEKGPQARDVRLVGGPAPRGRAAAAPRDRAPAGSRDRGAGGSRDRGPAGPRGRSERPANPGAPARGGEGVVARYDADRGFGFITPDSGGADLFVHVSVVRGGEGLQEGDRVRFMVRQSDRGPQADRVEPL